MRKHLREMKRLADEFGRDVQIRKRTSHLALVCRFGTRPTVFTSSTEGDHRTQKNLRKQLRHADEARNPG